MPIIIGKTNKSPEDCFSPIIFLAISTPKRPPNNPPIMVLAFKSAISTEASKEKTGFSKKATILDPNKAPITAPRIMESLFKFEMESVDCFL